MDGRLAGYMNGWIARWMDGWLAGWLDEWVDSCKAGWQCCYKCVPCQQT